MAPLLTPWLCVQVKNPWARKPWKGRYSASDTANWTPALRAALGVSEVEFNEMSSKGIFWIEFADCRKYFKSFFLNCTCSSKCLHLSVMLCFPSSYIIIITTVDTSFREPLLVPQSIHCSRPLARGPGAQDRHVLHGRQPAVHAPRERSRDGECVVRHITSGRTTYYDSFISSHNECYIAVACTLREMR
jgi:hypothetical protein